MKIVKTTIKPSPYSSPEESYKMDGTMIDFHILVQAMSSYVHGGYKGNNTKHLEAAEKLHTLLTEAWCSDQDGTFEGK